jgi:aldehyde dehydrogenase
LRQGHPLDTETTLGAQISRDQLDKVLRYVDIGRAEGARILCGGEPAKLDGDLAEGCFMQPTVIEGDNSMRVFQEEIFGPVVAVTRFSTLDEAVAIANDTPFGLGAGVWSRDTETSYLAARRIQAGRVWVNCYQHSPAHAAFGGYKHSGFGRETHKMALEHFQQTKNLLVSYTDRVQGVY